jgi:hypothetical protein
MRYLDRTLRMPPIYAVTNLSEPQFLPTRPTEISVLQPIHNIPIQFL